MKKFAFLAAFATFAMAGAAFGVSSANKTIAEESANSKTFTFVERLGSASTLNVDAENQEVQFKGGWDSKFLIADGVDVTDSKTTFSMHVKGTNGDGSDLQQGFGIYHDADNYMMAYLKWDNCGTIASLSLHAHVNGQWSNAFSVGRPQWNEDYVVASEWYDSWSDYGGWSTDSDTPTGDKETANWNHFRQESSLKLVDGFDMGFSIERVTYKDRLADQIQVYVSNGEHTWYTAKLAIDAFTNPNGGEDSPYKEARPQIGLYNCNVDAITYSDFKYNGASIKVRDPNDTTNAVVFRSTCGTPLVRTVNENRQTIDYQGSWDSCFLLADGLDTSSNDFTFSADVKGTIHDADDVIIGYTLYHNADNYMKFYLRWSNCGTIDGVHMHGHVNGSWTGGIGYAKGPDDSWSTTGEFADAWSDGSGWITDSETPGITNQFRGYSAIFLDTGFTMGISVKRVTYKERVCDAVQLSVTGTGTQDGQQHTWYTPVMHIDAFTCPNGGEESALVNDPVKIAFTNNKVGTVNYSNIKFNGSPVNVKAPNYYKVSFDVEGIEDQYIEDGLKAAQPDDPVQDGAIFDKWMNGEEEFSFDSPINSDTELTAAWLDDRAVVTFDSKGGSSVEKQKIVKGEKATAPENPTKQWHTFDGWYEEGADTAFDFENTVISENVTLEARWTEVEVKTDNNVYLNKFLPAKGTPEVLSASEDGQSLNFKGSWDGNFAVTDQFDTSKKNWEISAHVSGEVGDGADLSFGFVIYYDENNYVLIYARYDNCGTIDGIHMKVTRDGRDSDVYQGCRDYWGESLATKSTFYDNWSDFGGWTTGSRTPYGDESTGNWNHFRSTSQLLLNSGFDVKLYVENTTFGGRDVQKFQFAFTDLDKNEVKTTWYSSMIVCDAFTNPLGGEDSAFKNTAPKVGLANNKTGTINYSNISFRETPTRTVTFDVNGETSTNSVINGYRVGQPADPEVEGYTFNGWKVDGEAYDFNTPVTGDITIVADLTADKQDDPTDPDEPSDPTDPDPSDPTDPDPSDPTDPDEPTDPTDPDPADPEDNQDTPSVPDVVSGCGGSILASSLLLSVVTLAGAVLVKSKKEDK